MSHEQLGAVSREALIRELIGRAITQGEAQKTAFDAMVQDARLAAGVFAETMKDKGAKADAICDRSPYANGEERFWVLRTGVGHARNERYGGGELYGNTNYGRGISRDYYDIVIDGNGSLTVAQYQGEPTHGYPACLLYPYDEPQPEDGIRPYRADVLRNIFNVNRLRMSPTACEDVYGQLIADVQATTIRVLSGNIGRLAVYGSKH